MFLLICFRQTELFIAWSRDDVVRNDVQSGDNNMRPKNNLFVGPLATIPQFNWISRSLTSILMNMQLREIPLCQVQKTIQN